MGTGSWLLLARNTYLLEAYKEICLRNGYVFESSTGAPIDPQLLSAIRLWERLRAGKNLTVAQVMQVYEWMSTKVGVAYGKKTTLKDSDPERILNISELKREFGLITEDIWHVALDKISIEQREYLLAALKRGEKVDGEARIRINTIHSVKGGQADNVVLYMDMAQRTYAEYKENPDDEARVWYVAITRAKSNFYAIYPKTANHYPLDMIIRG
jgi:superfamily I DNA/RNA helicase